MYVFNGCYFECSLLVINQFFFTENKCRVRMGMET